MLSHSASQSMLMARDDFDHIFSDSELQTFLDKIASADNPGEDALTDMFGTEAIGLQFLPPEPVMPQVEANGTGTSQMSSFDDLPRSVTHAVAAAATAQVTAQATAQHLKALNMLAGSSSQLAMTAPSLDALTAAINQQTQHNLAIPSPSFTLGQLSLSGSRPSRGIPEQKPQVSHSTVEKQRRDRINSLIDELRELVPPSKATLAAAAAAGGNAKDNANSEARRPKHVVLADTIAILKQLSLKGPLTALLQMQPSSFGTRPSMNGLDGYMPPAAASPPAPPQVMGPPSSVMVKEEPRQVSPSNSNSKGSVSSHEDVDMSAAPKLPNIPIQPTMLSGVVVERGPDCMYVQVKCRDRKGLLLDIIHALKQLPLEVRTAAVTTQEGLVRDVFEVCVDDQSLQPEEVQNMVHEALFQQYGPADPHKRARR